MSVYKEGYHAITHILKNSKQIFPDASDFGAPTKKNDTTWNYIKQLVNTYGEKDTRKLIKYSTGKTVTQIVSLIDEHGSRKEEHFKVTFTTTTSNKNMDGYVYIEKL